MGELGADTSSTNRHGSGYVGRFAPSPTGDLHLGSLLAAFGSWLRARAAGGRWLLRIEDIDPPREVPGAALRQLQTLADFGLEHDGEVLWQSARGEAYRAAIKQLLERGLAFECHCSRSDLAAAAGIHRHCLARPSGRAAAIRLRVESGTVSAVRFDDLFCGSVEQAVDDRCGDFVLLRADGCWAYQLAVVVDDAAQGVSEVVRGADLLDSSPRQILLQRALGLPQPRYAHLPLVLDAAGNKLSKSAGAGALDVDDPLGALRLCWAALGQLPSAVSGIAKLNAWLEAAVKHFEPERVPASNAHAACQTPDKPRM